MGKRTKNLFGLSHFAKQAFQHTPAPANVAESASNPNPTANPPPSEPPSTPWHAHDATHLVPHYKFLSEVPPHLQKYFYQRKRYFSLYDHGCLLDEQGWYSVTPERIAAHIADRCRSDTVLDAFCGVGGNAIAFAQTCEHVIAMDNSPVRLALARHNARIYGVADRIEFILADYIAFAHAYLSLPRRRPIDVVFLSPPWGGPDYIAKSTNNNVDADMPTTGPEFSLGQIKPIPGADLFHLTRRITPNVAYYVPRNTNLDEISALLEDSEERVEVEEAWMGTKLKALTCYFGGLAEGQRHLF